MPRIFSSKRVLVNDGSSDYTTPVDWLPMPELSDGDQKIVMLVAVYEGNSNFVAFKVLGNYTVDWGDGSSPANYANAAIASRNIQWADVNSATLTSKGYRQVLITITPQAGQTLTQAFMSEQHPDAISVYRSQTLSVVAAGAGIDRIIFTGACLSTSLERFEFVGTCNITYAVNMFNSCYSLQEVVLFDTSNITNLASMFYFCTSLKTVPLFDFSNITTAVAAFQGCFSLGVVPLFDFSSLQNSGSLFSSCFALKTVPLFDFSSVTSAAGMFDGCYSLESVPLFYMPMLTNVQNMFTSCYSLKKIPHFVTGQLGTATGFAQNCYSLQEVPAFDFTNVPSYTSTFINCYSLHKCEVIGVAQDISFANCKLSADTLNTLFTNLGTVTGKTITITGNWGAATCDPTIATAKGWTVVI